MLPNPKANASLVVEDEAIKLVKFPISEKIPPPPQSPVPACSRAFASRTEFNNFDSCMLLEFGSEFNAGAETASVTAAVRLELSLLE